MTKSTTRVDYLGMAGIVQSVSKGAWDFIYRASTVKDPKWNVGDRCVLPDGREFRYAKSIGACISGQGCEFTYTGYVAYTNFADSEDAGVNEITIPAATHAVLAEDELVGGYVLIFVGDTTNNVMFRQIVGNASAVSGAAFKVQLDGDIDQAIVSGTSSVEVYQNPYAALRTGTTSNLSKAGVPAIKVSATATYFWVQTKGLIWCAPQANLGNTGGKNGGFWHDVGNISDGVTALAVTIPAAKSCQYAGYTVSGSISGNGPLFMLTG